MRHRRGEGTVTKRKDKRYEVAIYMNTPLGIRRVRRYAKTRPEAEALLVELRNKNDTGVLTNTKEQKLGDYLDYWLLTKKSKLRPGTYVSYESTVRLYLKPGLGNKCLTKLSVRDVRLHLDNQARLGASNRNLQKQRMVLCLALKSAEREDILSRNVAQLVEPSQYQPKEIIPWDLTQLGIFLDHASSDPFFPIFLILTCYGLRTSEALGLTWQNIDFDNKVIHVRQQLQYHDKTFQFADLKTKAGQRDLPLLDIVNEALLSLKRNNDGILPALVFKTKTSNPIFRRNLLRSFKRISKNAGIPTIALHHLRHTTATILKDIGAPARDTQLILGHAHISTTQQIYQHSGMEQRGKLLEQYEQKIVAISGYSRQIKPSNDLKISEIIENNRGEKDWFGGANPRLMSPAL